jgi:hypothetical protein
MRRAFPENFSKARRISLTRTPESSYLLLGDDNKGNSLTDKGFKNLQCAKKWELVLQMASTVKCRSASCPLFWASPTSPPYHI